MDTNLPSLDIVEDLKVIMDDDEPTPEQVQETINEVEKQEVHDDSPFIQKVAPKKKKELSEKQKAHLEKIRKLAQEKKEAKKKAKEEALNKVEEEHKAKSYKTYKPRKPRTKKTEEQKQYDEKTIKMEIKEPREDQKNIQKNSTPEDFVPSHKEELEKQRKMKEEQDKFSFMNFMGNMEKYLVLKDDYDRKKSNDTSTKKVVEKPRPAVKQSQPKPIIQQSPLDPYSNYFG